MIRETSQRSCLRRSSGGCEEAGIPCRASQAATYLTIHHLRHNGARWHKRHGTPVHIISKLLGHTRISTTERYLGMDAPTHRDVARAARAFEQADRRARSLAARRRPSGAHLPSRLPTRRKAANVGEHRRTTKLESPRKVR
jgi:integrase